MTEMEAMLEQLQAAPLENAGLVASVRKQCDALGFRTGARVTFDVGTLPADSALDPGTRQALFRVAQEALANVARHARARNISVSLGSIDGQLVLTVQDDGGGFKPEGHTARHGHGQHRSTGGGGRRKLRGGERLRIVGRQSDFPSLCSSNRT